MPTRWRFPTYSLAVRLFFTCWLIYSMHFATNIVREIYLALAIGEYGSFRVDEYAGLHPDLFETPGHGWHINNNPGASMMASIPYALNRLWIEPLVEKVKETRSDSGAAGPPQYESPWPLARQFYSEAWRRGFDIKLGLAAFVMQIFLMAPLSAAGVVLMFAMLRQIFESDRIGFWLAILYAFGTPIFFRTGALNQNLITAHVVFAGFVLLWERPGWRYTQFLAGLAGGLCVLLDYSGIILLIALWIYAMCKMEKRKFRSTGLFAAGTMLPLLLLWFYQWKSFGNPIYPPQYYMPAINPYVETGFRGFVGPQPHLMWSLLFDYRYGLFMSCPLLLLALLTFRHNTLPKLERLWMLLTSAALWIFFSGVNYTHLQFNTGIRYLVAIIPFLFLLTAIVLRRMPQRVAIVLGMLSIVLSWCLAMYRDVERGAGIAEPVIQIFSKGPQLPALTTLSRMEAVRESLPFGGSPLPLFAVAALVIYWMYRPRVSKIQESH